MAVTRCVCFQRTFAELLPLARQRGWTTVTDITNATRCGSGCGGCSRYLKAMLRTGHTSFAVCMDGSESQPALPEDWEIAGN